jgi:hypothetical protein
LGYQAKAWQTDSPGRALGTLHSTTQHSTAQHSTAQHSTAQHSTAGQQMEDTNMILKKLCQAVAFH